jgi:hypothetical protein
MFKLFESFFDTPTTANRTSAMNNCCDLRFDGEGYGGDGEGEVGDKIDVIPFDELSLGGTWPGGIVLGCGFI